MPTFSSLALARLSVNTRDTQPHRQTQPKCTQVQPDTHTHHTNHRHTHRWTFQYSDRLQLSGASLRSRLHASSPVAGRDEPSCSRTCQGGQASQAGHWGQAVPALQHFHHPMVPGCPWLGPPQRWYHWRVPFLGQSPAHPASGHHHQLAVGTCTNAWPAKRGEPVPAA